MTELRGEPRRPDASGRDAGLDALRAQVAEAVEPECELLRRVGSGRMAHVFLARELALRRLVAVKVLRPRVGTDEATLARFDREARAAAAIKHPNIPAVHRIGRLESGLPYIVQEYVEGRTLRDSLEATGTVAPAEVRRILRHVSGALAASHEAGVIHRDVRPENVIVQEGTGSAFLMDFGLAGARDTNSISAARITRTGEVLGDPRYIAPEQLRGEQVTTQADIYSVGILGYELLTLSHPFLRSSDVARSVANRQDAPRDLPWQVTAADPELASIVLRCLHENPARRPTAAEIRDALSGSVDTVGRGRGPTPGQGSGALLAPFPRLAGFVAELRRRHVYQVAAAYVLGAYVLLELSNLVLEGLAAPELVYSVLVILTLAGFPVVLALSWIFDVTTRGIERTEPGAGSGSHRTWWIVGVGGSIVLAGLVGWLLLR